MQKAQRKKRERKGRKVLQIAYPLKKGPSDFFVGKVSVHEIPLTTRSARPSAALQVFPCPGLRPLTLPSPGGRGTVRTLRGQLLPSPSGRRLHGA